MNFNTRPHKRISFTPIMLTSKSIHPVDRSDYEIMRNQRKFSGLKKSREELSQYIIRNSSEFHNNTTYGFSLPRQPIEYQQNFISEDARQNSSRKLLRKMTTPAVVKVQFQDDINRRKIENKLQLIPQNQTQDITQDNKEKIIYFTNAKTFEQFTKMAKIRPQKKNLNSMKDEVDQQWSKYLNKYYLNIRKVKPLLKKQIDFDQLSPQKNVKYTQIKGLLKNKRKLKNHQSAQMQKIKAGIQIRTHSKRQSNQQREYARQSQRDNLQQIQYRPHHSVYKKIQQDINLQRFNGHKKDFFIFGMGETVGKISQITTKNKFQIYKDFLFRVNFTNGLYIKNRQQNDKTLKFFVGFGNNSAIIKGIMHRRYWWQLVDKISDDTNFVWTQLKVGDYFKKQSRNNIKFKPNRYQNCNYHKSNGGSSTGIQPSRQSQDGNRNIMNGQDLVLWERYISNNQKYQQKGYDQALPKRIGGLLKKKGVLYIENNNKFKVHNHLQSNYFLGNKKALYYSLKKYYELTKEDVYSKIPLTFHITQGIKDPQFDIFLKQFEKQNEKRKTDKDFRNIWIIKPGQFTNRGRGITVCSTLDEIKNRLKSKQRNANGTNRTFIVQKYIQKPLLYQRRKFDIRHYMAINCHNGKIKGYWYAQGYLRTTSCEYNIKNTKDLFTHLTNDAVQKYGQDYGRFEKGNKISYSEFQKYIFNNISTEIDFQAQILPKMKQLALDSIKATYSVLDPQKKQHNFQLFGLDFMLDQSLNVYLIEVNTNPCLQTSCPLLTKIITPLVQNVFKLCLDPLFPPPFEWPSQKKYFLGDNPIQQNKFSLFFDEVQQGPQLRQLYQNTSVIDEKMGDIFEEDEEYQDEQKQWNDQEDSTKKVQ